MNDHIIKALCATLMHSLWQGILLAVITGAIIIFTKKASAAFRYNLLIGALTLFAFGVIATFTWSLQKSAANGDPYPYYLTGSAAGAIQTTANQAVNTAPVPANTAGPMAQPTSTGTITETVIGYFNAHYNTIVFIWFLIICAKSVQMAVGLHSISHLKRTGVSKVSKDWESRLLHLARQLYIRQAVSLMESGIARVPMVVGHLKPVILIPLGLINSLTVNEVEAILIHELAHIRRRDYLVNLLQSFMEIVFFFNPAVLWISHLIKTERENCCDDLAIAQSRNKESYIRALVSCEEYHAAGSAYAMAFPGARNTLLHRVNRIVGNRNYSLSLFEKTILAVCLVVTGLGISALTTRENSKREHTKKTLQPVAVVIHPDTRTGHMQSAPVNNGTTPPSQSPHPAVAHPAKRDTTKRAFDTTRAIARELYREHLLTDTDHLNISLNDHELIVNNVRMAQEVYDRIYGEFGRGGSSSGSLAQPHENRHPSPYDEFLRQRSDEIADEIVRDDLVSDKNHFTYTLSRNEFVINGVRQSYALHRQIIDKYFKPGDNFNLNYNSRNPYSYVYDNRKSYSSDSARYRNSAAYYQSLAEEQQRAEDKIDKKLVADLLQDGLITDPINVSFTLDDKSMIVNGKKQSAEVYKKYKEKYRPNDTGSGWSWTYSHHE